MSTATADAPKHAEADETKSRWPRWKLLVGGGLTATLVIGGGLAWFLTQSAAATPLDRFQQALQHIAGEQPEKAREIAKELEEAGFEDENFPGGIDFLLGMAAFQLASRTEEPKVEETKTEEADSHESEEHGADSHGHGHGHAAKPVEPEPVVIDPQVEFALAAVYLRKADEYELPTEQRPVLAYALGRTLYELGELTAARDLLREAYESNATSKSLAAELLAELALEPSLEEPGLLERGLTYNHVVLDAAKDNAERRQRALLQRAELFLAQQKFPDAMSALTLVDSKAGELITEAAAVMQGRILIAEQKLVEAGKLLQPIADLAPSDRPHVKQACFLMGHAAELRAKQLGREEPASKRGQLALTAHLHSLDYYQKTIDHFENSEEGVIAALSLGRLWQSDLAHEKAIRCYGIALRSIKSPEEFRNRWISLEQFRQRILQAWTNWSDGKQFSEALALSELMTPLFPRSQAYELTARTHQKWAESLDEALLKASADERAIQEPELQRHWRESGAAFAQLASLRLSAIDYPEAVWTSAEHYRRGHDFTEALKQVNQFLENPPEAMRPLALVRRAQLLMDLDRLGDALVDLETVTKADATTPAVFTAQYLLGVVRLEQDDVAGAEKAWRAIIHSDQLTPDASEWRDALLALGKLTLELAGIEHRKAESQPTAGVNPKVLWEQVGLRAAEATTLLEEYVGRFQQSMQISEARYALGKSLQIQAANHHRLWLTAETENARLQSRRRYEQLTDRALQQFQQLRDVLGKEARDNRLDALAREILQNVWFEVPHCKFALDRFEESILDYAAAINHFPQDVRTLTAYVQMAQGYTQLGRHVEARSMLEQAKVILSQKQIPETAFVAPTTNLSRAEWEAWLDRARQVQQ